MLSVGTGCCERYMNNNSIDDVSTSLSSLSEDKGTIGIDESMNKNCRIIVNGTDITDGNYAFINCNDGYALIPLTATMKALGATVSWKSETVATIKYNGIRYTLDIAERSLVKNDEEVNILIPPPGISHKTWRIFVNNDFIVDNSLLMLLFMSIDVKTNIDYENLIIYVDAVD